MICRVQFRSILQPPAPKTLFFTMNFNDFRGVVFKLQNPPRTRQNPPRTRQNPPKPTQNPNRKRHHAIQRPPRRAHSALKHIMFSYSYNGNPETPGSMSYVFCFDQIQKSLTPEEDRTRPTDDKQSDAEFAQPPPAKAERSSPALIPSTSPALILTHMHTFCRAFPGWSQ